MRTDCNNSSIRFAPSGRRNVVADFDGGQITSDAGALLLREVARPMRVFQRIAEAIPDPRDPSRIVHDQQTLLAQRVIAIACGWEDLNDHHGLRVDPLMQVATERGVDPDAPLASPATLCRLENRIDRRTCVLLSKILVELFIESFDTPPQELTLDFDATDDPVHGRQDQRFFHGYYDHYCYLPLYVFSGEKLLCAYLRSSNIDESRHAWAVLALLVRRLRQQWPGVRIILRGDSGFCRWKMLRWCDRHRVDYIVGLAKNDRSIAAAGEWIATARKAFDTTQQPQRIIGEVDYAAHPWEPTRRRRGWVGSPRRVIARIEHTDKGSNPRFILTSLPGEATDLHENIYCARGEMENRIKEQQLGLFADRTSCSRFIANQFRLLLSSFAYVLMQTLRQRALAGTELARAQMTTIRTKLLKIGAVVRTSVRRVVLHLSGAYPLRALFEEVARKLVRPVRLE